MQRYYKHVAEIAPKQGWIKVYKHILKGNNPRFLKFESKELVKKLPLQTNIPMEEYEVTVEHFDNKAFQMDDRFFTTKTIAKRYNKSICNELCKLAIGDLNIEPIQYL